MIGFESFIIVLPAFIPPDEEISTLVSIDGNTMLLNRDLQPSFVFIYADTIFLHEFVAVDVFKYKLVAFLQELVAVEVFK